MMQSLEAFLDRVKNGEPIAFQDAIAIIAEHYDYSPVRFVNGVGEDCLLNEPGVNEGSCKIFSFARLNNLSEAETLALFGHYYRKDVLGNPDGDDHRNIRNFMKHGWAGIRFESEALVRRG